jgi:NAD(P)-dependent dehydrogenase (short-subunit alcohol dehydrogenase family)
MQALAGKKIVVVGGSVGVGRAIVALAHREGVMPQTRLGEAAAAGYARYLNTSPGAFVAGIKGAPTPEDVAAAVVDFASRRQTGVGAYLAKGDEVEALT